MILGHVLFQAEVRSPFVGYDHSALADPLFDERVECLLRPVLDTHTKGLATYKNII